MDIFERELKGEIIAVSDPEYWKIAELIEKAQRITAELNTGNHRADEVREIFKRLTGRDIDKIVQAFAAVLYRLRQKHNDRQRGVCESRLHLYGQGRHYDRG